MDELFRYESGDSDEANDCTDDGDDDDGRREIPGMILAVDTDATPNHNLRPPLALPPVVLPVKPAAASLLLSTGASSVCVSTTVAPALPSSLSCDVHGSQNQNAKAHQWKRDCKEVSNDQRPSKIQKRAVATATSTTTTTPGRWAVHCSIVIPSSSGLGRLKNKQSTTTKTATMIGPLQRILTLADEALQSVLTSNDDAPQGTHGKSSFRFIPLAGDGWKEDNVTAIGSDWDSSSSLHNFHISLTRGGVALQSIANIEPFVQALTGRIQTMAQTGMLQPFALDIPFATKMTSFGNDVPYQSILEWDILPSESTTTTTNEAVNDAFSSKSDTLNNQSLQKRHHCQHYYLVWRIVDPVAVTMLTRLVDCCNNTLALYNQDPYYTPPIFHVSMARLEMDDIISTQKQLEPHDNDNTNGPWWIPLWKARLVKEVQELQIHHLRPSSTTNGSTLIRHSTHESADSCEADEDDSSSDSQSSSSSDAATMISTLHVTFGTTKRYVIPFDASPVANGYPHAASSSVYGRQR